MQLYKNAIVDQQILLQCDGSLHIGDSQNGQFNGYSITYFPDGCTNFFIILAYYQGEFQESVPNNVGLYKLKNSCLKIQWNNYGQISSIQPFDNKDFIYDLLNFEKSEYGNILRLRKTDKFAYGAKINGKFEGFCIHEFQNKIYYGYFENGLPNNQGIIYDTNWILGIFKNGKLIQKLKSGLNMPPKEEIIQLFKRSHKNYKNQHDAPLLSTIQRMILDYLTNNNTKSTFYTHNSNNSSIGNLRSDSGRITDRIINKTKSGYEAVSSENTIIMSQSEQQNDDLGYYKQASERPESQTNKLTKQETEEAKNRLSTKKSNGFDKATPLSRVNFRKQQSQNQINYVRQRTQFSQSPVKIVITRRSSSPAFVTFRPLFTMVRL